MLLLLSPTCQLEACSACVAVKTRQAAHHKVQLPTTVRKAWRATRKSSSAGEAQAAAAAAGRQAVCAGSKLHVPPVLQERQASGNASSAGKEDKQQQHMQCVQNISYMSGQCSGQGKQTLRGRVLGVWVHACKLAMCTLYR
jgi:hypothetical protein